MIPEVAGVRYIFEDHHHPLVLVHRVKGDFWGWVPFRCRICDDWASGLFYNCKPCGFLIHKSCAVEPQAVESHLHHHPLTREFWTGSRCSSCDSTYSYPSNFYKCSKCDFSLDQKCALPELPVVPDPDPSRSCPSCGSAEVVSDEEAEECSCSLCFPYRCLSCKLSFRRLYSSHNKIQHPSHPFHPLSQTEEPRLFKCNHCLENRHSKSYRCEECDFDLDYKCALLLPGKEFEAQEPILNHTHKHPLALITEESSLSNSNCIVCYEPCTLPAYGCRGCLVNAHKECATAGIPKYLHHPLSPSKLEINCGLFTCSACLEDRSGLYYEGYDGESYFKLDTRCAYTERPLITFDGHSHPLIFVEAFDGQAECNACGKPCPSFAIFSCPTCDIKLHLSCGPLPCSIKQETHLETLVLKDSHVEDWTGYEEIFCDSCEERRDPYECVYYCARCNYSAEIKCVMPELKNVLTGKSGDVELRTLGRWGRSGKLLSKGLSWEERQQCGTGPTAALETEPGSYMKDIFQALTVYEQRELDNIFHSSEKLFEDLSGNCDGVHGLEEEVSQLAQKLDSIQNGNPVAFWERDKWCVPVGEYMVPEKLLRVYNDLHRKYGDLSAETKLSPGQKALLFVPLCEAVEGICSTKVVDVTVDQLEEWCFSIKVVWRAGFKVQFAIDALKAVVFAYLGLHFRTSLNGEVTSLAEEIAKDKAKLEKLEETLQHHEEYFESKEPSLIKECIEAASSQMYNTAGEVALLYNRKLELYTTSFPGSPGDMDAESRSLPDLINHPIHTQICRGALALESSDGAEDSSCTTSFPGPPGEMDAESWSLPDFINHPIHAQNCRGALALESSDGAEDYSCAICGKQFREDEPVYSCSWSCGFKLHRECSSTRYIIEAQPLHEHPLCFIDQVDLVSDSCHLCSKLYPGLPMFLCSKECKFSLHLVCGPLPCSVLYNGYELTLRDSLIDNTGPDDVWCDVCEERRDPTECVYHNPDIRFTATVNCVLPQIIAALKGDLGDVELRTVGGHIPGRVIGMTQVEDRVEPRERPTPFEDLSPYEQYLTRMRSSYSQEDDDYPPSREEILVRELNLPNSESVRLLTPQDIEQLVNAFARSTRAGRFHKRERGFSYSDDALEQFKEQIPFIDIKRESYLTAWRTDSLELVEVGNKLISSRFVSIYREFVDEYGDFSEGSSLSPAAKAIVFNLFFSIVYSMRGTQVRDVNDVLLRTWQHSLTCVRDAGFKIQFVFDNLEKLVQAHFGVKVMRFRDETTEVLEKQAEELARKIDENEAKLGKLKSMQEKYMKPKEVEESLLKRCLIETAKWKWNNVGDLIF